jgi:hypothetical protein
MKFCLEGFSNFFGDVSIPFCVFRMELSIISQWNILLEFDSIRRWNSGQNSIVLKVQCKPIQSSTLIGYDMIENSSTNYFKQKLSLCQKYFQTTKHVLCVCFGTYFTSFST